MADPAKKKPCKTTATESHSSKRQQLTLVKSLTSTAVSYILQLIEYVKGSLDNKQVSGDNVKELISKTEGKIKEVYGKILKEVKIFQENELPAYKHHSKEELAKAEIKFKEYSSRMKDILEELIRHLEAFKNGLKTKIKTYEEVQNLITFSEEKIDQIKKLTQDMKKHIEETIKDPDLKRKLSAMVETNYRKIKGSIDALYADIKKSVSKVAQLKSLPEKKTLFSKIPTFGKMKTSIDCSSVPPLSGNGNETAAADYKENAAVGLNKEKVSFFNLSKHFNSKTIYGRANVAKATYAGILIYYIYRKVKNTT